MTLRVVFVLPGFPRAPGGGHRVVYEYANALSAAGDRVTILHMRARSAPDGRLKRAMAGFWSFVTRVRRPRWFLIEDSIKVRNYSTLDPRRVPEADVIVATAVTTADFVAAECRASGAAGAYFIQHFENFVWSDDRVLGTWRLPLLKIVVSPWLARRAESIGEQAVLIPNAIDGATFSAGPPLETRDPSVLAMVSPIGWKRTDLVVAVFGEIAVSMPWVRLDTFGVGPRPPGLTRGARHTVSPSRDQLVAMYQSAQVFICTSDSEGFGLPIAEALSCGAAVVTTDNGGGTDVVRSDGIIVPVGDAKALYSAAKRLLEDPASATANAARGQERVRAWSPSMAAVAFRGALDTAVASSRRGSAGTSGVGET